MKRAPKVTREPCPKCREDGHDRAGDNLSRFPEGNAYCNRCGYKEGKPKSDVSDKSETSMTKTKLTTSMIEAFPIGGDPTRGISKDILEMYKVRVSMSETDGSVDTVYYPYFKGKNIFSYKVRKLPKSFMCTDGGPTGLFGKNTCEKPSINRLLITEGEEDCLAAKEMITHYGIPKECDVVSLPNGASLDKVTTAERDFFKKYDVVNICLDPDDAGRAAANKLAGWIAKIDNHKKEAITVLVSSLSEDIGDISRHLTNGHIEEFHTAVFKNPKLYEPEGIVSGMDISLEEILEPEVEGYTLPFAGMQNKLHGVRKGEILTLCAGSGIGKTTMCREIVLSLIEQGCSVANIALEDQMKVTAQALVALDMNIPLTTFRFNPPPKSEVQPHFDKLIHNEKVFFFRHFAGLNSASLIDTLYNYARIKGVDFIILDHLSMVVSGSESQNERKDIDMLMTKLAQMVVETGVGLIQIVHLKRTDKNKSFAHGGEVELTDLRGSAALEQLSWAVVGLERDQQGDDHNFSRIRILKNRTFGFTGLCDTLYYNPSTGRMANVEAGSVLPIPALPAGTIGEMLERITVETTHVHA